MPRAGPMLRSQFPGRHAPVALGTSSLSTMDAQRIDAMDDVAKTLKSRGDLKGAEDLHREVFDARFLTLGPEHPDTLTSKSNLALSMQARGDLKGAEKLHREVFDARSRTLGPQHPDTLRSKENLALALQGADKSFGAALKSSLGAALASTEQQRPDLVQIGTLLVPRLGV